jgi:hypothetical protein
MNVMRHGHMSRCTATCHDARSRVTMHGHVSRCTVTWTSNSWQTFVKVSSTKFGENPPSCIRSDTFGKTDRRDDGNRYFSVSMGSRLIKCESCCPVPCSQYAGPVPSMHNLLYHSSVHKLHATLTPPPPPVYHRPSNSAPWIYRTTGNIKQMAYSTWPDAVRSRLHRWRWSCTDLPCPPAHSSPIDLTVVTLVQLQSRGQVVTLWLVFGA